MEAWGRETANALRAVPEHAIEIVHVISVNILFILVSL